MTSIGNSGSRELAQRQETRLSLLTDDVAEVKTKVNTDLAKKPRECLDYSVLHEMVHLLEPTTTPTSFP
jgi:hypothetical protein